MTPSEFILWSKDTVFFFSKDGTTSHVWLMTYLDAVRLLDGEHFAVLLSSSDCHHGAVC